MKITILNLSRKTTTEQLIKLFETYGTIASCNIVMDQNTGGSKGFGFIEMPNEDEAKDAINNLHGTKFDGNTVRVKVSSK